MANLIRVHGSENSFYLLDQTKLQQSLTTAELSRLAQQVNETAPAELGPVDGVLVVSHSTHTNTAGRMQVFNQDGSQASMCGNGLRTVTRYLAEQTSQTSFTVETDAADLPVKQTPDFAPGVPTFSASIQPVSFDPADIGLHDVATARMLNQAQMPFAQNQHQHFSAVAVPNPHLISLTDAIHADALTGDELGTLGKRLNSTNLWFPDGVNVSFGWAIDETTMFVRTFERGVGFTNACGTGMSATSLVWTLTQADPQFDRLLTIYNPGGMVNTVVHNHDGLYTIDLIGNATFTDTLTVAETDLHAGTLTNASAIPTGEESNYQRFVSGLPQWSFGRSKSRITQE